MTAVYPGYGSQLQYSTDGVHFMNVTQLRKFAPLGSKQMIADRTNSSPPEMPPPRWRRASADSSQVALFNIHVTLVLACWTVQLSDNYTSWTVQGFLSEFVPYTVEGAKTPAFTAKIRVWPLFLLPRLHSCPSLLGVPQCTVKSRGGATV